MKTKAKKITTLVLCLVLAFSMTGCIGNLYENVCTIDDTEISAGLYCMALYTAYSEARAQVGDSTVEVLKQKIGDQNASSWIQDRAEELCRKYVTVHRLTREMGITLSEASSTTVQQQVAYYDVLTEHYEDNGISKNTMVRFYSNQQLANQLFYALYDTGGEKAVPDAELKKAYGEKHAHLQYIMLPANSSEEGVDVSAEVDAKVEEIVAALQGGKSFDDMAKKEFMELYQIVGKPYDITSVSDSVQTMYLTYGMEPTATYSAEFLAALAGQAEGDYHSALIGSNIMIYRKIPTFEDDAAFQDMRDTVLTDIKKPEFEDYLRSIYDAYEVNWRLGARWYYSPGKVQY